MRTTAAILALLLTGCVAPGLQEPVIAQMYEGPPRPLDQVAVIAPATPSALATHVNGTAYWEPMIRMYGPKGPSRSKGIHVLPGRHVVRLAMQADATISFVQEKVTFTSADTDLEVELKAGHTYVPRAGAVRDGKVRLWLEDMGVGFDQTCLIPRQSCLK